jgi:radical SAM-linked protein
MVRNRIRLRFSKQGDLRLISHRDLMRVFERLFRRTGVALAMSQGFHPRPQMNFPAALAVGIEARDEVAEFVLAEQVDPVQLCQRLNAAAPPGLLVHDISLLEPGAAKARVQRVAYELPVPAQRQAALQVAVGNLCAQSTHWITRTGRKDPLDLRAGLDQLVLRDGKLSMGLIMAPAAQVRPQEVLHALGLSDLESRGFWLTRTKVELAQ